MIAESVAVDENSADLKKAGASYYKKFDAIQKILIFFMSLIYLFLNFFAFINR